MFSWRCFSQENHRINAVARTRHPELLPLLGIELFQFTSNVCHSPAVAVTVLRVETLLELRKEAMNSSRRRPDRSGSVYNCTNVRLPTEADSSVDVALGLDRISGSTLV